MENIACLECGKLINISEGITGKLSLFLHRKWAHSGWSGKVLVILAWSILGLSGIFFVILGLISLQKTVFDEIQGLKAKSWPKTKGIVERTWIDVEDNTTGYGDSPGYMSYTPHILYQFEVGGILHQSDRIRTYPIAYGVEGAAKRLVSKYFAGKHVTVYYNPDNPKQSILEPGIKVAMFLLKVFFGLLIFALGIFWTLTVFYIIPTHQWGF